MIHSKKLDYRNALVAHNCEAYRTHICEMLSRLGVRCHAAVSTGKALLRAIRNENCNIVFIPGDMPGASALEIIDVVSQKRNATHIIISGIVDGRIQSAIDEYANMKQNCDVSFVSDAVDSYALATSLVLPSSIKTPTTVSESQFPFSRDEIAHALDTREIVAHFQPQHCLKTGAINGAELLIRWQHPVAGLLAPPRFLPQLESFNLDDALLDSLINSIARLRRTIDQTNTLKLAINVPARYARSASNAEWLIARLNACGASCLNTVIEVTEDGDPRVDAKLAGAVAHWRISGMDCAIDDFGVASSSIIRLCTAPFNVLKLDRAIMQRALKTLHTRILLTSTIEAVHAFGMTVVAEGIETSEELTLAKQLNCDIGQGYFFGAAMPEDAFYSYAKAIGLPKSKQTSI